MSIRLTEYSHGAGCGCKLSPSVLNEILEGSNSQGFAQLLVGNAESDDAAVFQIDEDTAIISTTDFFMPIVDDPYDFGAIAATNAISDVYAMGGTPIMSIAILGWPIDKLPTEIAKEVLKGAREVCKSANIPLAGGHSIDAPEPIFGLAVTGKIKPEWVKKNSAAQEGDLLYLTKPLGVGLVTTAQKKGLAAAEHLEEARKSMLMLNSIGAELASLDYVHAVTDVTGFGLAGHAIEMAEGSGCSIELSYADLPRMSFVDHYLELGTTPGGTTRNWQSYGHKMDLGSFEDYRLLTDPQTSGGLLVAVDGDFKGPFEKYLNGLGNSLNPIGKLLPSQDSALIIK